MCFLWFHWLTERRCVLCVRVRFCSEGFGGTSSHSDGETGGRYVLHYKVRCVTSWCQFSLSESRVYLYYLFIYLLSVLYLTMLFPQARVYSVEWEHDKRMMNLKGLGRKRPWPNLRYLPDIQLEGLRKTTKTSIGIAGLRAEIWTWVSVSVFGNFYLEHLL
jgi:hypothetical protein